MGSPLPLVTIPASEFTWQAELGGQAVSALSGLSGRMLCPQGKRSEEDCRSPREQRGKRFLPPITPMGVDRI